MYTDFDSFFSAFKSEILGMSDREFLQFLDVPETVLTTLPHVKPTFVNPQNHVGACEFASDSAIALCA